MHPTGGCIAASETSRPKPIPDTLKANAAYNESNGGGK
jgi:hypothetical protein